MATLRNRNGKWQAQVRIKGHVPRSKSFTSKRDAERWARQTEAELEVSALHTDHRVLDRTTVRELLDLRHDPDGERWHDRHALVA